MIMMTMMTMLMMLKTMLTMPLMMTMIMITVTMTLMMITVMMKITVTMMKMITMITTTTITDDAATFDDKKASIWLSCNALVGSHKCVKFDIFGGWGIEKKKGGSCLV